VSKKSSNELFNILSKNKISYDIKTEYHVQVKTNKYTFNIYPTKNTIYLNGATSGTKYVNENELLKIIKLQTNQRVSDYKSQRKTSYSNIKKHLWLNINKRTCFVCGRQITDYNDCSIEHKIPLGLGGSNRLDNLALSHKKCNKIKGCNL